MKRRHGVAEEEGFEPSAGFYPRYGLANRSRRPLEYSSTFRLPRKFTTSHGCLSIRRLPAKRMPGEGKDAPKREQILSERSGIRTKEKGTPARRTDALLRGEHFRLRPLTKDDMPARLEMVNNPDVQTLWVGVPADKNTLEDMESWYWMLSQGPPSEQWAIETKDGRYVGDIDLHSLDEGRKEAWFTPMWGDPVCHPAEARRDILGPFIRYVFNEKGMERLSIQIADSDPVGVALLQQLGFTVVDRVQFDFLENVDELTMQLEAADFSP